MSKIVIADNPWRIAAAAKKHDVPVMCVEMDGLPEDKVYVIDPQAVADFFDKKTKPDFAA